MLVCASCAHALLFSNVSERPALQIGIGGNPSFGSTPRSNGQEAACRPDTPSANRLQPSSSPLPLPHRPEAATPRRKPMLHELAEGAKFFFQAEDGIRDDLVTGVQTCALPI